MKYINTFDNMKYASKLKLKKYIILKPFVGKEKEKLQISEVIHVEDKLSTINNNDILIKTKLLYEFKSNYLEPKKINNLSEVDSYASADHYFNMKDHIIYQSNSLEECLDILPILIDSNKYNI